MRTEILRLVIIGICAGVASMPQNMNQPLTVLQENAKDPTDALAAPLAESELEQQQQ